MVWNLLPLNSHHDHPLKAEVSDLTQRVQRLEASPVAKKKKEFSLHLIMHFVVIITVQ